MRDRDLYAAILGVQSPWHVSDVQLDQSSREVRVLVEAASSTAFGCPECGADSPRHDHRERRWRHLDTCQFRTILVAKVPRVDCAEHGVHQVKVPWSEPGSRFTALFEALVIDWLREAPLSAVARLLGLSWDQVDGIMERAVQRGLARRQQIPVEFVGVDEASFRKGHRYVTFVTDLVTGDVLHVAPGRTKEALAAWLADLRPEQRQAIQAFAMDMWKPFIAAVLEAIPLAKDKVCFDRFHVAQHLGDAVDRVRREEHRRLKEEGSDLLTGTRMLWRRRAENLGEVELRALEVLEELSLKTAKAWGFKENAAMLWRFKHRGWALRAWTRWIGRVMRSRLEPMKRVARMIRDHLWGIVNAIVHGVTNAGSEATAAKVQRIKRRACGFRNMDRFVNAILFHLGGLDLYHEVLGTHTKS